MKTFLKWLKRIGIALVGLGGFVLALVMTGNIGKKRVQQAEDKMQEAEELRVKADLIGRRIEDLKEKKGRIDKETKTEIERIQQLDSLEEINNEFDKLF